MNGERNFGVSRQAGITSAERIARMDGKQSWRVGLDVDERERVLGGSRPVNGMSAQRLARIGIMHEVQRSIDELYSGAATEYDAGAMIPTGSQIPLRHVDGKVIYA